MTCHNKVYVSHLSDNGEVKKVIKLENYDFLTMRRQIEKKFALGDEEYEFRATIEPNGPYIQIDETDDDIIEEVLDVKVGKAGTFSSSSQVLQTAVSARRIEQTKSPKLECDEAEMSERSSGSPLILSQHSTSKDRMPPKSPQLTFESSESWDEAEISDRSSGSPLIFSKPSTSKDRMPSKSPELTFESSESWDEAEISDRSSGSPLIFSKPSTSKDRMPSKSPEAFDEADLSSGSSSSRHVLSQPSPANKPTPCRHDRSSKPCSELKFDVLKILEKHPKGPAIITEYEKNGYLCPGTRMSLVTVVTAELVRICGYYPSVQAKEALAAGILTAFPNLRDKQGHTGYEHFFASSGGQSGYIQGKLKNIRRNLPSTSKQKSNLTRGFPTHSPSSHAGPQTKNADIPLLPEADAKELESYCRNATGGAHKVSVMKAMAECVGNRLQWVKSQKPFLSQVLARYPRFLDIPELIDQDFQAMYPLESPCLLGKWEEHAKILLQYASNCRQERVKKMMEEYNSQCEANPEGAHLSGLYGFLALLRILQSHNTRGKGRVSTKDADRYLMSFYPVDQPVEMCLKDDFTRQPTLIVHGTKSAVHQLFIKIEDKAFILPTTSIITAVDLLYKCHYVFNLEYASPLKDFFLFLQSQIYGISYGGTLPSRIRELSIALKSQ